MMAGMAAALAAAFVWTLATRLFQGAGAQVPPVEMNAAKGLMALLMFSAVLLSPGRGLETLVLPVTPALLLVLSGLVGIGLGDTAYFRALQELGTRRVLLLELLAAPFAATAGCFLLRESLAITSLAGLVLTLAGVALAVFWLPKDGARRGGKALAWGVAAAFCQAVGMVMARQAFTTHPLTSAHASWWRLAGAEVMLLLVLGWRRKALTLVSPSARKELGQVLAAAVLGTFLGIWLQQTALSRLPVAVAQTLLATAPLCAPSMGAVLEVQVLP